MGCSDVGKNKIDKALHCCWQHVIVKWLWSPRWTFEGNVGSDEMEGSYFVDMLKIGICWEWVSLLQSTVSWWIVIPCCNVVVTVNYVETYYEQKNLFSMGIAQNGENRFIKLFFGILTSDLMPACLFFVEKLYLPNCFKFQKTSDYCSTSSLLVCIEQIFLIQFLRIQ